MKITIIMAILFALILALSKDSFAVFLSAEQLYKDGEKCIQNNDNAKAYLTFRELVRDHPSASFKNVTVH